MRYDTNRTYSICVMSPIVAEASTETFYVTVLTLATICDKTQIGLVLFVSLCQR
jgi:hypothetical protein